MLDVKKKKDGWSNAYFDVSGLKSFTSRDKFDDALDSRCIMIRMIATRKSFPIFINEIEATILRTFLLRFRLKLLLDINNDLSDMTQMTQIPEDILSKVVYISSSSSRYRELVYPFCILVSYLSLSGLTVTTFLEQFAKNLHEEFEVDEMISTEAIVVQACVDYFNETGDLKPTSGDISKVMPLRNPNAKEDKDKYYSSGLVSIQRNIGSAQEMNIL